MVKIKLLEVLEKNFPGWHLTHSGGCYYMIVDLNNYGRIIHRGRLSYLLGFLQGILFHKYNG